MRATYINYFFYTLDPRRSVSRHLGILVTCVCVKLVVPNNTDAE
jgi:hypothetical protein